MNDERAFTLGPQGWDFRTIVRLLTDPRVRLPPVAIIYHSDIDAAEASGATSIKLVFAGIARDRSRKGAPHAGYHERVIDVPLAAARMMAWTDYTEYLTWRDAALTMID